MERLSFANKRIMIVFFALFLAGIVTCILPVSVTKLHHLPAFSYITMILIWSVSIRRRIVDDAIRQSPDFALELTLPKGEDYVI